MTIDKAKLQALAEAAKAGGAEWSDLDINTERMYPAEGALVELCEFATPAVLVELLAANALAEEARDLYLADKKRLLNEVNDLRASIQGLKTGYEAYERVNAELRAECEKLRTYGEEFASLAERRREEVEALRKDAERYRWLRDESESIHQFYLSTPIWFTGVKFSKENVDSTIDAAMSKEQSHD